MKKTLILTCLLQITTGIINAQTWSGSTPGNIYYNQGSVGIGTSSPVSTLHVTNQASTGNVITVENYQYNGLLGGLHFASGFDNFQSWSGIEAYGTGGVDQQDLRFYVTYGTRREAMRIDPSCDVNLTRSLRLMGGLGVGTNNLGSAKVVINADIPGGQGLDLSSSDAYANLRVIQNTNGSKDKDLYLGFNSGGVSSLRLYSNNAETMTVKNNTVGIGVPEAPVGYKLAVAGKIIGEEVKVKLQSSGWPDYVFKPSYQLMPLKKVEHFIRENGHLPEVPSAKQVEQNGVEIGANQAVLLKKIEELTLYIIDQQKQITQLQQDMKKVARGKRNR